MVRGPCECTLTALSCGGHAMLTLQCLLPHADLRLLGLLGSRFERLLCFQSLDLLLGLHARRHAPWSALHDHSVWLPAMCTLAMQSRTGAALPLLAAAARKDALKSDMVSEVVWRHKGNARAKSGHSVSASELKRELTASVGRV